MNVESIEDEEEYGYWYDIISDDIKNKIMDKFGNNKDLSVNLGQLFDAI